MNKLFINNAFGKMSKEQMELKNLTENEKQLEPNKDFMTITKDTASDLVVQNKDKLLTIKANDVAIFINNCNNNKAFNIKAALSPKGNYIILYDLNEAVDYAKEQRQQPTKFTTFYIINDATKATLLRNAKWTYVWEQDKNGNVYMRFEIEPWYIGSEDNQRDVVCLFGNEIKVFSKLGLVAPEKCEDTLVVWDKKVEKTFIKVV